MPPSTKAHTPHFSRTNSSPGIFDGSIDRPMRLAEIYVAAEHALRSTISDSNLWKSLSSMEEFEVIVKKDCSNLFCHCNALFNHVHIL